MNEFDIKARDWDKNPMHYKRSKAVSEHIRKLVLPNKSMTALEFGAGTGSTGAFLADDLKEIVMIDTSQEMVRTMKEKIKNLGLKNLKAVLFDLENNDYPGKFDLIFTQMVLHHVHDTDKMIERFSHHLNPGGYLAVADLYTEDGSFHGQGFDGHKGFDPEEIGKIMHKYNFAGLKHMPCFTIEKQTVDGNKKFDVFILTGKLK